MPSWHFIIDVAKCENCNNCFLACKDEHVENDWPGYSAPQPRHGHRWMNIFCKERGQYPLIDVACRPTPCMHCDDAPCIAAAGPGQIQKRPDGIVLIDPEKACGNRDLPKACPYGAMWWNADRQVAQKCTLCAHLLDDGWKQPRCVQVCPTGALQFVDAEAGAMRERQKREKLTVLHPEYGTAPRVYYKNLYRFQHCFIAGSIAYTDNGRIECAAGATVIIANEQMGTRETTADAFGDFKFDALAPQSGTYRIEIRHAAHSPMAASVDLEDSVNLGTMLLS